MFLPFSCLHRLLLLQFFLNLSLSLFFSLSQSITYCPISVQHETEPVFHPSPGISRPVSQLTEEEQIRIAKRMGLIQQLPSFTFAEDTTLKTTE